MRTRYGLSADRPRDSGVRGRWLFDGGHPADDVLATPCSAYRPVDYPRGMGASRFGDVQISVPKTWMVVDHGLCGGNFPPIVS